MKYILTICCLFLVLGCESQHKGEAYFDSYVAGTRYKGEAYFDSYVAGARYYIDMVSFWNVPVPPDPPKPPPQKYTGSLWLQTARNNAYQEALSHYYLALERSRNKKKEIESSTSKPTAATITQKGTGFVVSPDGHLITAYHIVKDSTQIRVKLEGKDWFPATLQKHSFSNDVAVLKVNQPTPKYLSFVDFSTVQQGQKVFTLGYPVVGLLGDEPKYTEGTISSLTGIRGEDSLIQISVPVQPGNSGGPLVTASGRVVGMITSTAAVLAFFEDTGTLPQNVNWAVKSDYIIPLLPKDYRSRTDTESESIDDHAVAIVKRSVCLVEAK